jgi:hypothetical protein
MRFTFPKIRLPFFERTLKGDNIYSVSEFKEWAGTQSNLDISQNHPILTPALLFVAKLYSQARYTIEDSNGNEVKNHWLLKLLERPNYFQTVSDFMESLLFMQISEGVAPVWKRGIGKLNPDALYILDPNLIEYPEEFRTRLSLRNENNTVQNTSIVYDKDGENRKIPLREIMFFYDLPNCLDTSHMFKARSRIDGLKQTLFNTKDSLIAKNIILKTNGKELITLKGRSDFPLTDGEKSDAEQLLHLNYGLAKTRKRGLVTKAELNWQSMHVPLRDLGLDESIKVDGNIIYTALHIPKDILSLEAKKTTYNNFKESMVSYIQNEMQPTADSNMNVFNMMLEDGLKIRASYDHLPIMQFILIEKFEGLQLKGQAISALRAAGLPDEVVLEQVGLDPNTKLGELTIQNNNNNEESRRSNQSEDAGDNEEES